MSSAVDQYERFGTGLTALIIDDEETIRLLLSEVLEGSGFTVTTVESYEEGLQRWSASSYDLVMTDKNLPDGSGLTLAQSFLDRNRDCEVIVMSGYASVDAFAEAMRLNVADFLLKPFLDLEDVRDRVRRTVAMLKLRREHRKQLGLLEEKERLISHLKDELLRKNDMIRKLEASQEG